MAIKLKRLPQPTIRMKALPAFPARVVGGAGITVTKANGTYTIAVDDPGFWTVSGDNIFSQNVGNVGVGTDNPLQLFQVGDGIAKKRARIYTFTSDLYFGTNGSTTFGVAADGGALVAQDSTKSCPLLVGTIGAESLILGTNNSARITVNSSGAVKLNAYTAGMLRTDADGDITATAELDVFLVGGQSNATIRTSLAGPTTPTGKVKLYDGSSISDLGGANEGGAWAQFGLDWYNATGRTVLFIMAASGDTGQIVASAGVNGHWDSSVPGSNYFMSLTAYASGIAAAVAAGYNVTFRGILWSQGENDAHHINIATAGATKAEYKAALIAMIAAYRMALSDPALPFYIFRTGINPDEFPGTGYPEIRDAQEEVAAADLNTRVVFRDASDYLALGLQDLAGSPPVHYTAAGYNRMGRTGAANILAASSVDTFRPDGDGLYWSRGGVTINRNVSDLPVAGTGTLFRIAGADSAEAVVELDTFAAGNFLRHRRFNGTADTPTALLADDAIGGLIFDGYDGSAVASGGRAAIFARANENWSGTHQGTRITVHTTPDASTALTEAFRVNDSGGLSVGFTTDGGAGSVFARHKLSAGANSGTLGQVIINGSSSGAVTQTVQTAAGTPTVTWGTNSGTPVVSATSPLSIVAATGNLTVATGNLTKTDDVNVTLTLGGTPTAALFNAVSLTLGWTGVLAESRGGTGISAAIYGSFYKSTNQAYTASAQAKVLIDTAETNQGLTFDGVTNNRVTIITSGRYRVGCSVYLSGAIGGDLITGRVKKNGSTDVVISLVSASASGAKEGVASNSKVVAFTAGDYIELYGSAPTNSTIHGVPTLTFMSLEYIGA